MITRDDIRRLLIERRLFSSISEDLDDQTEILLDSMSLTWFLHALEEEYGLELSPVELEPGDFTSVESIHRWVQAQEPGARGGEGAY